MEGNSFLALSVYKFDVGCNSGSVFEIDEGTDITSYCNTGKPKDILNFNNKYITITYYFDRTNSAFINEGFINEGFAAQYEIHSMTPLPLDLQTTESIG